MMRLVRGVLICFWWTVIRTLIPKPPEYGRSDGRCCHSSSDDNMKEIRGILLLLLGCIISAYVLHKKNSQIMSHDNTFLM